MSNGLLGKAMSVAGSQVQGYAAPAGIQFATININCLNTDPVNEANVSIAITTSGAPSAADYIDKASIIPANGGVLERNCIIVSPNEKVYVKSDNSLVAIRVSGLEQL